MPNENHETYGGNDISTYTDDISGSNTFTNDQIEACVLSAGVAPYSAPLKIVVANYTHEQCTGGPNLYSPFYKESNSNILWYDEGGLGVLENTNYWWYKHCIYVSKTGNKIASSLKVQNYRNFLEIVTHTWADIRGVQHKTYYPRITTKYGTIGDWHDSVLQPALLIYNTTDGALAKSVEQTEPQSYWYWGGPSNVQNGMGGGNLFTRDLNNGTVSNDNYAVPWEPTGSDPIRIKEGGSDYTFPVAFVSDHITSVFYGGNPLNLHQGFNTQEDVLLFCAFCGLKFEYNETVYKPLANGGVVYGYTADMSQTSDWDNWRDIGDHVIPDTPPSPVPPTPPSGDDMDVMNTGATGSSGGFTHFYIMSPQNLIDLLADFYDHASAGETLSNNLVCSYILGIPSSKWVSTENVPVAIHNSAQGTPFVSVANYKHVTATNNMLVTGTFDVPRRTNTFYDFSPYSTYEVFIPCCGWVRLPDTVAGRTINVYLYLDIASCCVKGQVMISGAGVCAVVNGALGSPIPMAVIESGILRGNNIQAGMGMIGGAIQTGVSAGNGNSMGIGLGAERILSGLVNCTVAGNTNYTEQKGGTGDITQFAMGHQCYMKITHPEIDPVVNEAIFGHTVGYLCNTVGQLSNFHGFTMCSNPHINISASDREREEIKQFLEQGVILP